MSKFEAVEKLASELLSDDDGEFWGNSSGH